MVLKKLDADITTQWIGVNSANTATAGLAIGSAVTLLIAPPVGVGLGLCAAATGGATTAADLSVDCSTLAALRRQMALDIWNTIAVAELENDWLIARTQAGQPLAACDASDLPNLQEDINAGGARLIQVGSSISNVIAEAVEGSVVASNATEAASAMRVASGASRAFAVFGAVAATGRSEGARIGHSFLCTVDRGLAMGELSARRCHRHF